LHAVCVSVL
ncbi:hypothetical protein Hypma_007125, partial [Hypsizygus marmoreus]